MSSSKSCTLKILDEVSCFFVGLHPDHIAYFWEEYSEFAPNYFFNPKYKLGQWDGKLRYFFKTGKTYVNLLDEIVPKVIGLGYNINLVDQRSSDRVRPDDIDENFFGELINPKTGDIWKVRDYQIEMINTLFEAGSGVGIAGTGAGKTSMCAAIALSYERAANLRSIIIVPDKNLTRQTRKEYAIFGLDVGEFSGDDKDYNHMHVVSTWACLKNRPELIKEFQVVIVDECHGLRGNILTQLLNEYGKDIPYRFGVTGTLPKEITDKMAVHVAVGPVRYTIPAHKLIEQGYLADLQIDIFQLEVDLKKKYQDYLDEGYFADTGGKPRTYIQFKDSYLPDWTAEKNFLRSPGPRLNWIANYIEKKRDLGKGNVLCLVDGIKFGKRLAEMIPDAIFLYGEDKMKDREAVYNRFKTESNLVVIATIQIASTGLDIPRIFHMMGIDLGKSFVRIIQSIGRGLRKSHDKDSVHFSDICSDLKYSKKHMKERIKYFDEAKYPWKKQIVDYSEQEKYDELFST
jgi:superfamily II DNA or RNA helicase